MDETEDAELFRKSQMVPKLLLVWEDILEESLLKIVHTKVYLKDIETYETFIREAVLKSLYDHLDPVLVHQFHQFRARKLEPPKAVGDECE